MPIRPDLTGGFNLTRRPAGPVKLPRMSFPMVGGPVESAGQPADEPFASQREQEEISMPATNIPAMPPGFLATPPAAPEVPAPAQAPSRVVVYGRSNCQACMAAVQDLIDRGVTFTYYDVSREEQAMSHLQAITSGTPVVPVVVYIGFGGT